MTPRRLADRQPHSPFDRRPVRALRWTLDGALLGLMLALNLSATPALAQSAPDGGIRVRPATSPGAAAEDGVRWQKLKPQQRDVLKPLQHDWSRLDATRRQKWIELADRLPSMPPDERARVQERMADWAKLTPVERAQARLRFEEAKQVPSSDRRSRWAAYQALPSEQKNELAARAAAARAPVREGAVRADSPRSARSERSDRALREGPQAKSNLVPNPAFAAPPRPISPTVIQAAPGATTTLITRRPAPPPHQQTGLPKIAATPEFVNRSTLLPQRGPQGAAVRPVPASAPVALRR